LGELLALRLSSRTAPVVALAGGLLVIAIGAGLVAAHVTVFALDETLMQQSAVHYTSDLPHSLFHDQDARATNRLYPLVLSIAFRLFNGASAVRFDHVLSVLLFVSAGIPVYLFARTLLRSRWAAVAVALLSVALPWLTLTSALFTENLSYPLFWWTMLAVCRAVWRRSPVSDLVAMVSIGALVATRVQFVAVYVGYLLALLAVVVWRADGARGLRRRVANAAVAAIRGYPIALAVLAAALAVFAYESATGQWHSHIEHLLGSYSEVVNSSGLPSNMSEGALIELLALALGIGLVPGIVSIAWFGRRIARPSLERSWVQLGVCALVVVVFVLLTVYSQGGYLGRLTEERYFFYVVPVFWVGAFAALEARESPEARDVGVREILFGTVLLAVLFATIPFLSPLNEETAFLAPIESAVPHLITRRLGELGLNGLSLQDALVLVTLAAGAVTAFVWQRRPAARLSWTVGVAAAVQLVLTGYCYAVIDGKVQGIPGRTGGSLAALGWVDRQARSANVLWLDNLPSTAPFTNQASPSADQPRTTLFWNSRLRGRVELAQTGLPPVEWPLASLPQGERLSVNLESGRLEPAAAGAGFSEVVGATNSAFVQLAGSPVAESPDRILTLTRLAKPASATWLATGLQEDGAIVPTSPVATRAFATGDAAAQGVLLTARFGAVAPKGATTELVVRFGSRAQRLLLRGGSMPRTVRMQACFAPPSRSAVSGSIKVRRAASISGRLVGGVLESVALTPLAAQARACPS
jgi:hypothetical protein